MSDKYKIVIVGGGTAGWMSALYAQYKMPEAEITLVESDSIGILGAGEGTTPAFIAFLDKLGIPLSRLIKETSTTFKNGIKFAGWTNPDEHYYHGFLAVEDVALHAFDNPRYMSGTSFLVAYNQAMGKPFSELNYCQSVSEDNKVSLSIFQEYDNQILGDPLDKYFYTAYYANHFDAIALAKFFRTVATDERGVTRVEGKVVDHTQGDNGDLLSIKLESGDEIHGDLFIDCTGFAKKFIGGVYESEWESHKDHLTVDSAMPFFLPIDEHDIPAYTESTAMKYGWMWKIPLQHRYGCGYVFDSNYINDEEAKKEILEFIGDQEVTWPRESSFSFEPGYFKTPWINNCVAVGLSGGFIEPLEATSIWSAVIYLDHLFKDTYCLTNRVQSYVNDFNDVASRTSQDIFEFVYFHYMGGKTDTPFWEHYQDVSSAPQGIQDMLALWEERVPHYTDYRGSIFPMESWIEVAAGLGKLNSETYKKTYEILGVPDIIEQDYNNYLKNMEQTLESTKLHIDVLKDIKQNYSPPVENIQETQ